jgi:hypothetical protein
MKNLDLNAQKLKDAPAPVFNKLAQTREGVFAKFPLLFTLLGTFGLVATFYGFEGLIDKIDFLSNNPGILLGVGLSALIVTGTLYKKLG